MDLIFYIVSVFGALLALIIPFRARGLTAFVLGAGLLLYSIELFLSGLALASPQATEAAYWQVWAYFPRALIPSVWLLFSLRFSRGNPERFVGPWAGPVIAAFCVPLACVFFLQDHLIVEVTRPSFWYFRVGLSGFIVHATLLLASAGVLMNLERTFRAAVGTMRWRIKYFILGTAILFVGRIYSSTQVLLASEYSAQSASIHAAALAIASIFFVVGLVRSDSFQVRVYPSERVLHASVTAILVGGYLVIVGVLSKLVKDWAGPEAFAAKAFAFLLSLSGLSILLLSERARERLRRFVSRHFHRPFYDYRSVWLSFTEKTASVMDPSVTCRVLVAWISENVKVLSASAWLIDRENASIQIGASTGLTPNRTPELSQSTTRELIDGLSLHTAPFIVDERKDSWIDTLKSCYPDMFRSGGARVCVPLVSNNQTLGFLTLGDRVNGIRFSDQDFDLLKCVADQVAGNLLNIQLSKRLLQVKEMEAFQTIAAFFVHDLKNTVSSLNLTLQNLPKYWDNPEFRQDALRAIGKSVTHINDLIKRLTLFRQRIELQRAPTGLPLVIEAALDSIGETTGISRDFGETSPVSGDPDQLGKVFTNLFLNAREASQGAPNIRVKTAQQNGWVIAEVADNGCGMPLEFIKGNLFRPFQTTKKGGIGIGMFQSKAIVEAHGGKIEVDSEPGKGTTFRVFLPAI